MAHCCKVDTSQALRTTGPVHMTARLASADTSQALRTTGPLHTTARLASADTSADRMVRTSRHARTILPVDTLVELEGGHSRGGVPP